MEKKKMPLEDMEVNSEHVILVDSDKWAYELPLGSVLPQLPVDFEIGPDAVPLTMENIQKAISDYMYGKNKKDDTKRH